MQLYVQCSSNEHDGWSTVCVVQEVDAQAKCDKFSERFPNMAWRFVDESEISNKTTADWSVSLELMCPYCNEIIDLLANEWPEGVEACEQGTDATRNVEVECSGCDRMLLVDYQY